ncbi:hypothetical protein ACFY7C_19450 [Streptomyces sp. NPDC012769]|uniref:hypothetical protein n=1 Tax=Streptomyces sp. NPDC012769 TaxID=3364848 RepID=UPI00369C20BC
MKIKELREALAGFPDDMEVILQKDAEGNGYSPLAGGEESWYEAHQTWCGDAIHEDDYDPAYNREATRVLVLFPVN